MVDFKRPVFHVSRQLPPDPGHIHSLPDLIDFNAEHNPHAVFAGQEIRDGGKYVGVRELSFGALWQATQACARLLVKNIGLSEVENDISPQKPVALFLESDVTFFIHLSALLYLGIPVALLSIRLTPQAITHLLRVTDARAIILSPRTEPILEQVLDQLPEVQNGHLQQILSNTYDVLLDLAPTFQPLAVPRPAAPSDDIKMVILHSSGTTGLPKPIFLASRYLLGYAACHRLEPEQSVNRPNVSTLPMYHGFGLLAPCLSLSTGKPCYFPSAAVVPSALSTTKLLKETGAASLLTVPSILEEALTDSDFLQELARLDFVAVGGGAIQARVGEYLVRHNVQLLNHYGATEIGAIAPIFVPGPDYDWHYVRLRTDMGLELHPFAADDNTPELRVSNGDASQPHLHYQTTGFPFGWEQPFVIQDRLSRRPNSPHMDVAILGRQDDLLVLANGKKLYPQQLESILNTREYIGAAIVFGQHRETIGVMVESAKPLTAEEEPSFLDRVWEDIQQENTHFDAHARVQSRSMICIKPSGKVIPLSDKGSVKRQEAYTTFEEEIIALYDADQIESQSLHVPFSTETTEDPGDRLRSLVQECVKDRLGSIDQWQEGDDFFERGMDSLEATRLARLLSQIHVEPLNARFIYQHPSLRALATALSAGTPTIKDTDQTPERLMEGLVLKYHPSPNSIGNKTVLVTGGTGHLGVHLLHKLCINVTVNRIICLHRGTDVEALAECQGQANARRGVVFPGDTWSKIEFLPSNQLHQPYLGLSMADYHRLTRQVTHVAHLAWPMDFQRTLASFEPQVQTVRNLIDFAVDCHHRQGPKSRPHFLFVSSIATTARCPLAGRPGGRVLEASLQDPEWTADIGYAQAKWVCERVTEEAAQAYQNIIWTSVVRLGQVVGATDSGIWNPQEHFPVLLRVSQAIGALPDLTGTFSWIPVNIAADSILDILFYSQRGHNQVVYHVENPVRQQWKPLLPILAKLLHIPQGRPIPFPDWLQEASVLAQNKTDWQFLLHLIPFLSVDFQVLAQGQVVLDTLQSRKLSRALRTCDGVGLDSISRYIDVWQKEGSLS